MSQNLNRKPANSVNGDTDYDEVRVTTLGREFRGLQSEPDRYHATAGGNMGEVNDFRGFNDKNYFEGFEDMDSNFGSLRGVLMSLYKLVGLYFFITKSSSKKYKLSDSIGYLYKFFYLLHKKCRIS